MENKDIFNVEEEMQAFMDETNKHDLNVLIEELQRDHFPNVIYKAKEYREKYQENQPLITTLWKVSAISHAQIQEHLEASAIISDLYRHKTDHSLEELIVLGQLAFMCDFKLARRIMTDVVNNANPESESDLEVLTSAYLILGETEENLEKPKRAIKYYKQGMKYFNDQDTKENYLKLFLAFKIGMLYTNLREHEPALEYLKESLEYADDSFPEIKINSLVGIGQVYGTLEIEEEGFPYLQEALRIIPESTLRNSPVHMEALIEMGYYHYQKGEYEQGVYYYKDAIEIYTKSKNTAPRKLGMMYMQYAFCLANQQDPQHKLAGAYYEKAIEQLEKENDTELLHGALTDVIDYFDEIGNTNKKAYFEKRMLAMVNEA